MASSVLPDLRHLGRWDPLPPMWLEGRFYLEWARLIRDPVYRGVDEGRVSIPLPSLRATRRERV